jgi:hypothetical protein
MITAFHGQYLKISSIKLIIKYIYIKKFKKIYILKKVRADELHRLFLFVAQASLSYKAVSHH